MLLQNCTLSWSHSTKVTFAGSTSFHSPPTLLRSLNSTPADFLVTSSPLTMRPRVCISDSLCALARNLDLAFPIWEYTEIVGRVITAATNNQRMTKFLMAFLQNRVEQVSNLFYPVSYGRQMCLRRSSTMMASSLPSLPVGFF